MNRSPTAPEPKRVQQFAHFFKRYMSVSSVVAAALPIPVTATGLIPIFDSQAKYLSTYTSMLCFLSLGFFFYSRHSLADRMFPDLIGMRRRAASHYRFEGRVKPNLVVLILERVAKVVSSILSTISSAFVPFLPLLLILSTLTFVYLYHHQLGDSIYILRGHKIYGTTTDQILATAPIDLIPGGLYLSMYYIGIFLSAESAFIVMALKEYVQDLVGLSDTAILTGEGLPSYMAEGSQGGMPTTSQDVAHKDS